MFRWPRSSMSSGSYTFSPPLQQKSLSPKGKGLIATLHLRKSVPRFLTHCAITGCGKLEKKSSWLRWGKDYYHNFKPDLKQVLIQSWPGWWTLIRSIPNPLQRLKKASPYFSSGPIRGKHIPWCVSSHITSCLPVMKHFWHSWVEQTC